MPWIGRLGSNPTSLMLYSIALSAVSSLGGIVTSSAFAISQKSRAEFEVSERRRSDRLL